MPTQQAVRKSPAAGSVRFHVFSRPEWAMALVVVLAAALAAWLALSAERARLDLVAREEPAVPALAPASGAFGSAPGMLDAAGGALTGFADDAEGPSLEAQARSATVAAPDDGGPATALGAHGPAGVVQAPGLVAVGPVVGVAGATHAFDEYRLERERLRSRQVDALAAIVRDPSAGDEGRRQAQERLLELWRAEALELQLESALRAHGFNALVIVSDNGAHVVVEGVLDAAEAQVIGELTSRLAAVRREAVSIVDGASAGR